MKKFLLLGGAAMLLMASAERSDAQAWTQNFNSGSLPAGWSSINNDGHAPWTSFVPRIISGLGGANGWMPFTKATGDSAIITVSKFTPAGKADRWLISQSFTVSSNMVLTWEDYAPVYSGNGRHDSIQIWVSPTAGTTTAAFTQMVYNGPANTSDYTKHGVNLNAFNTQTVRVAFRDNTTDGYVLFIDNAKGETTLPAVDLGLTSFTPFTDEVGANLPSGGAPFALKGTVENYGYNTITSYNVKYQQGSNPVVSTTIPSNIGPYGTGSFTVNFPVPATTGRYPIKLWVEATGDVNHVNDSAATVVTSLNPHMPKKTLLIEEATGTWCGYCVRYCIHGLYAENESGCSKPRSCTQPGSNGADHL